MDAARWAFAVANEWSHADPDVRSGTDGPATGREQSMRSMWMVGLMVGTFGVAPDAAAAALACQPVALLRPAQTGDPAAAVYDDATDLWFTQQIDVQGRPVSQIRGKQLSVDKTVVDGRLILDVRAGNRSLVLTLAADAVEVRSGRRVARFDPRRATKAHYDTAKEVLAHSKVVARLRSVAAGVGRGVLDSPQGFDLQATDAIVALFDGDPSSAARLRERVRQQLFGVRARPAGLKIGDCWDEWKQYAFDAFGDLEECIKSFGVWNVPMRNLCNLTFTMQSTLVWYEMLGCTLGRAIRLG
jgi:hypothetical protein